MSPEAAQKEWKEKTYSYAAACNAYRHKGNKEGWDNIGEEPEEPGREHLVAELLKAIQEANVNKDFINLREKWPPAHRPLTDYITENEQSIPTVLLLDDNSILARIGASYEEGYVVHIVENKVTTLPDIKYIGRSPDRRYFAIAENEGIKVRDGWDGPEVTFCPWPTGQENLPEGVEAEILDRQFKPTQLIPFSDGKKVLLVSFCGVFLLTTQKAIRLLPTDESLVVLYNWHKAEYPKDSFEYSISMEHGAVSTDGKLIAVGDQDSRHLIYDDSGNKIGEIGTQPEYPHFALFSADNRVLVLNSCHFYNGISVRVEADNLRGIFTEPCEENELTPVLENVSRIYAGVSRDDEFILGDAYGYLICVDNKGDFKWDHFIGGTINDIDISPDEKTLIVSTYAGYISIIHLDAGFQPPYQIGTGNHEEIRRWIFWKNHSMPLIW